MSAIPENSGFDRKEVPNGSGLALHIFTSELVVVMMSLIFILEPTCPKEIGRKRAFMPGLYAVQRFSFLSRHVHLDPLIHCTYLTKSFSTVKGVARALVENNSFVLMGDSESLSLSTKLFWI